MTVGAEAEAVADSVAAVAAWVVANSAAVGAVWAVADSVAEVAAWVAVDSAAVDSAVVAAWVAVSSVVELDVAQVAVPVMDLEATQEQGEISVVSAVRVRENDAAVALIQAAEPVAAGNSTTIVSPQLALANSMVSLASLVTAV